MVVSLEQHQRNDDAEVVSLLSTVVETTTIDTANPSISPNDTTTTTHIDAEPMTPIAAGTNHHSSDSEESVEIRIKGENHIDDIANNNEPNLTAIDGDSVTQQHAHLELITEMDEIDASVPKFEVMRTFLESEFVPEEYWHLQRDSFIHRSYNEKLLAQKNEADSLLSRSGDLPNGTKRESFIKNSFNSIRRSFSSGKKKRTAATSLLVQSTDACGDNEASGHDLSEHNSDNSNVDEKCDYGIEDHFLNPLTCQSELFESNRRNSSSSSCASHRYVVHVVYFGFVY